jgi:hypothetical protein
MSRPLVDSITGQPIPLTPEQTQAHEIGQPVVLTHEQRRGLAGWPQELTEDQTQARDPAFAASHPAEAALHSYKGPFDAPSTQMYQWGEQLRNKLTQPNFLSAAANQGPMTGGAVGGLTGGAVGALAGGALNLFTGQSGNASRLAVVLGLLGAGVGANAGYWRTKSSAYDKREEVLDMISEAPGLGFAQRSHMMAAIPSLSTSQLSRLYQLLSTASGAAIGGIVAHFLMSAGPIGTLVGGALGGAIGHSFFGGPTDAMGYASFNSIF